MALPDLGLFLKGLTRLAGPKSAQIIVKKILGGFLGRIFGLFLTGRFTVNIISKIKDDLKKTIETTIELQKYFNGFLNNVQIKQLAWGQGYYKLDPQQAKNWAEHGNTPTQTSNPALNTAPITTDTKTTDTTSKTETTDTDNIQELSSMKDYANKFIECCQKLFSSTSFYMEKTTGFALEDKVAEFLIYGTQYNADLAKLNAACVAFLNNQNDANLKNLKNEVVKINGNITQDNINSAKDIVATTETILSHIDQTWDALVSKTEETIISIPEVLRQWYILFKTNVVEPEVQKMEDRTIKPKSNLEIKNEIINDLTNEVKNYIINKNGNLNNSDIKNIAEHINSVVDDRIRQEGAVTLATLVGFIAWSLLIESILDLASFGEVTKADNTSMSLIQLAKEKYDKAMDQEIKQNHGIILNEILQGENPKKLTLQDFRNHDLEYAAKLTNFFTSLIGTALTLVPAPPGVWKLGADEMAQVTRMTRSGTIIDRLLTKLVNQFLKYMPTRQIFKTTTTQLRSQIEQKGLVYFLKENIDILPQAIREGATTEQEVLSVLSVRNRDAIFELLGSENFVNFIKVRKSVPGIYMNLLQHLNRVCQQIIPTLTPQIPPRMLGRITRYFVNYPSTIIAPALAAFANVITKLKINDFNYKKTPKKTLALQFMFEIIKLFPQAGAGIIEGFRVFYETMEQGIYGEERVEKIKKENLPKEYINIKPSKNYNPTENAKKF